MRKFAFINSIGERRELNGGEIFFNAPAGLGMQAKDDFTDLEEGFFNTTNTKNLPQDSIAGELVFLRDAYSKYRELVNWLIKAKEMVIEYKPDKEVFYRKVRLGYLTKTELEYGKWLKVPVELKGLTPWYSPEALRLNFEADGENAMRYEFTYDEELIYGTDGSGVYSVQIPARGHVPTAVRVIYRGASAALQITLSGLESGKEYGRCSISGETAAGDTIELNTQKRDSYIILTDIAGVKTDLLEAGRVDITAEPFFRAPNDEISILQIEGDGELNGEVSAEAYFYYRSV